MSVRVTGNVAAPRGADTSTDTSPAGLDRDVPTRRKRKGIGPDDPRHGTTAGYVAGCREADCREADLARQRERRRIKRLGRAPIPCMTCLTPFHFSGSNRFHCEDCKQARIKRCAMCDTVKSYDEFFRATRRSLGIEPHCKVCTTAQKRRDSSCVDCGIQIHPRATRCKPCNAPISSARQLLAKPRRNQDGYIFIHQPDNPGASRKGWIFEHRAVMEASIGRHLLPGENVHHKNGVRDDNRPENLELWVVSQPKGQRPEDLLAWARHIIRTYGDGR